MDDDVFATPASNHARRKNRPPAPDADGLFDARGVDIICGRRQCYFDVAGDLFGHVQFQETRIPLTAIAPGLWDPIAVLSACTRAHGNRVYEVNNDMAKPTNPDGIDELRIARVVGAAGIRPYLSRRGRYNYTDEQDAARNAHAGMPTWPFELIITSCKDSGRDYRVRLSLRALEDVGLVQIELGPRGGMATAKVTWTSRAYLAPERLAPEDEEAMETLA